MSVQKTSIQSEKKKCNAKNLKIISLFKITSDLYVLLQVSLRQGAASRHGTNRITSQAEASREIFLAVSYVIATGDVSTVNIIAFLLYDVISLKQWTCNVKKF
jgi:hypothetical protein